MADELCALVTGANRGLGLALARTLLSDSRATVALAVRDLGAAGPCEELAARHSGRTVLVRIDYSDFSSAAIAAAQCAGIFGKLDVLVNCAAVNVAPNAGPEASKGPLERLAPEALMMMFATNVAGPVVTCQAFLPLLRKARRPLVVNISTTRASLALATDSRSFGYAVTKAALNMATRKIAAELRALDGVAVAVDPGWLRTRMGGQAAPTGPDEAAARLLRTVLSEENMANGRFLTAEGKDLPW